MPTSPLPCRLLNALPWSLELLDDHLPFHLAAELVHLEQFAVVEGREGVNVDLASLGEENRGRR